MNEQNERALRASYEALGRGEVNPFLNLLADDVEWNVSGRSPVAGNYIGKSQVMDFFSKTMNLYQGGLKIEVIDVLASDTHGVVLTKESGQHDGKSVQFHSVHVYSIDNGKLKEFRVFYDDLYHRFWQ